MHTLEPLTIDALVAEIGSTTTVVSAFDGLADGGLAPRLLGQGFAPTSVAEGDVRVGLDAARAMLEESLGALAPAVTLATSSAAGGLRMTVHGLTQKMTAAAAHEAALGAGAVVEYTTAGRLRDGDLLRIEEVRPSLVLLAGGVEGGDSEVVLHNAARLAELSIRPIVVYGGNSVVAGEARALLEGAGFRVRVTANVYPGIDELDIVPARSVIHDAFEEHITHAPGMERIGGFVTGRILPTPGAVLIAGELLASDLGDLVLVDVGGATSDVHSITDGSPEIAAISPPAVSSSAPAARSRDYRAASRHWRPYAQVPRPATGCCHPPMRGSFSTATTSSHAAARSSRTSPPTPWSRSCARAPDSKEPPCPREPP